MAILGFETAGWANKRTRGAFAEWSRNANPMFPFARVCCVENRGEFLQILSQGNKFNNCENEESTRSGVSSADAETSLLSGSTNHTGTPAAFPVCTSTHHVADKHRFARGNLQAVQPL